MSSENPRETVKKHKGKGGWVGYRINAKMLGGKQNRSNYGACEERGNGPRRGENLKSPQGKKVRKKFGGGENLLSQRRRSRRRVGATQSFQRKKGHLQDAMREEGTQEKTKIL